MFLVVCYDVETTTREGRRRLRRIAKLCESHGQRAQKSVFECHMDKALYVVFEARLLRIIDPRRDSLRIYSLPENAVPQIKNFGQTSIVDLEGPVIL